MPNVSANGIQIEYDTFGDSLNSPLLLIMGLGSQMTRWDEDFCGLLVKQGFYVIRFDNRDVGLSSKLEEAGVPKVLKAMAAAARGEKVEAPYKIKDMADDAIGLLDALGIDKAHVCGASMGGMIAQTMAVKHPSRVISLISIMSSTGNPELPPGKPEAMKVLVTPAPTQREPYIEYTAALRRTIGSPGFAFDEKRERERAALDYDRCFHPQGVARQLMAIVTRENLKPALASVTVPTLVIHGAADPLVPMEAGKDTAQAVPGSELMIIEGMGHDLPPEVWPRVVDAIAKHAKKAEG